ncbi:GNAT family N-acetyltransferase [Streptococcus loxodontisalivarius]|uniref:GNAT family N-acetyltransferase n=1 Tax=Streptococcus loxodontisalivarius TaxID=1349415 RepID=UPI0030B8095B
MDENNRRQGLASSLLEYLKGQAISEGAQAIALNSGLNQERQNAHNFYEHFGFEKSSMGFRYSIESKLDSN